MIEKLKKTRDMDLVLEEIAKIEGDIFKSTAYSYSTLLEMINSDNYTIFSYKEKEKIIAYLIVFNNIDCFEIMKIAVLPKYRNKSIATKLLEQIKTKDIFLEVRESNISAINFYLKHNFQKIALRKKYYKDNNENAIIMKLEVVNE